MSSMPEYASPPVAEVAIGVQFRKIPEFTAAHAGLYWQRVRERFPHVEERSPLPHVIEGTELPQSTEPMLIEGPNWARLWFRDKNRNQLIQLQQDRFLHNWIGHSSGDEYPRYDTVKSQFDQYWSEFLAFLAEVDIEAPEVDQCELTYVNLIRKGEGWETLADIGRIFTVLEWCPRTNFLPVPENLRSSMRFPLPHEQGSLHIDIVHLPPRGQESELMRLSLTARGRPNGEINKGSIDQWFDTAHEWIVKGFVDVVSETTDELWEKQT